MANPSEFQKEALLNNILLVKALTVLQPPEERNRATRWADFLASTSSSAEEASTKNEYLWYLLLVLQHGNVNTPPFNKHPAPGTLRPLSTVLPRETYLEVVKGAKNEIYFHDTIKEMQKRKVARDTRLRTDDEYDYLDHPELKKKDCKAPEELWDTAPQDFLPNQPRPHQGAICYAAVFSDYANDGN